MRITTVIGTTHGVRLGATTSMPSTAESTEIAGVMIASPKNSAAPTTPSARIQTGRLAKALLRQRHQRQRAAFALVVGAQSRR